jgi:hypothetical protein
MVKCKYQYTCALYNDGNGVAYFESVISIQEIEDFLSKEIGSHFNCRVTSYNSISDEEFKELSNRYGYIIGPFFE